MCGSSSSRTPDVVRRNPLREAQEAATEGQRAANMELVNRKRRQRGSSLLTMGAAGYTGAPAASLLATARPAGA